MWSDHVSQLEVIEFVDSSVLLARRKTMRHETSVRCRNPSQVVKLEGVDELDSE